MNNPKVSKNLFTRIHNVNVLKRKRDKMNVVDALHLNQVCSKIDSGRNGWMQSKPFISPYC